MVWLSLELRRIRGQELCESGGGRPGLPVPNSPYGLCGRQATLMKYKKHREVVVAIGLNKMYSVCNNTLTTEKLLWLLV